MATVVNQIILYTTSEQTIFFSSGDREFSLTLYKIPNSFKVVLSSNFPQDLPYVAEPTTVPVASSSPELPDPSFTLNTWRLFVYFLEEDSLGFRLVVEDF
jgi:hypothetical protein